MITATKNTKAFYNTEIPGDWEVKELGKIALVNMGQSPDSENYNEIEDGLPLIQGNADIRNRKSFKRYFTTQLTKVCDEGDLILSVRAPVGSIGEASFKSCIGRGVCALKPNKVDKEYLYQLLLNSEDKWKKIEQGSTFTAVSSDDVRKFKLLVPKNEAEQKAIAQVLSTADAAINTTEKLIAQKELRKKWLMQQLLTGKKRLKGFGGEWKEHSYEKILKVVKRNFAWDENELYKLISVRRRSGGIFYREALYGHQILVKTLRTANEGDFLFSKMQILHGASALVTKEFDGAKISGSYIAVVPKEKKQLNMEFFQWYSQTPYFYHQTYISSYGVHIEKMTFDFDTFLQLEMKLPSIEEQTAIATVLQAADKEISLLKAKAERLREQKKGLMQQLLTGKVRLKIN